MAKRSTASILIILDYAREQGVSVDALLANTGIVESELRVKDALVDDEQELQVLANLLAIDPDPFRIGIELGRRYQLTSYGIVGYALLASETMRKATDLGVRFMSLTYAFASFRLIEEKHRASLVFSCDIPGALGELLLIRDIWAVGLIKRELLAGNDFPLDLKLTCDEPDCVREIGKSTLEAELGGEIQFNQDTNAFVNLNAILDQPLIKGNDLTARICEEQCAELLRKKQNWKKVSEQVRDIILRCGLSVSMDQVSEQLARTTRTLHRQLKLEGTSWRQVRDNVRVGLAEELLRQPMQLEEIAERLGYSDATNFSHSFKRCTGVSPRDYRKTVQ